LPTGGSALRVLPVPTRVDQGEKERADQARSYAREKFERFLDWLDEDQVAAYWTEVETSYFPFYAFEEVLAVFADPPAQRTTLLAAMEGLASWVSDKDVQRLEPMDERARLETLGRFMRQRAPAPVPRGQRRFYVSYAANDRDETLERFVQDLVHEVRLLTGDPGDSPVAVWLAPGSNRPGDRWEPSIRSAIEACDAVLLIASPSYFRSAENKDRELARTLSKPVLTVDWIQPVEVGVGDASSSSRVRDSGSPEGVRNLQLFSSATERYRRVVQELARQIVAIRAARTTPPPLPASREPGDILVIIHAERRENVADRGGQYGLRRRDWVPFPSNHARGSTIHSMLSQVTPPQGKRLRVGPLLELDSWLQASPRNEYLGAIVIVDPMSMLSMGLGERLRRLRRAPLTPLAFIFCVDGPSPEQRVMVEQLLHSIHPDPLSRDRPRYGDDAMTAPMVAITSNETEFLTAWSDLQSRVVQLSAALTRQRHEFHPTDDLDRRGELTPCKFTIAREWQSTAQRRWRNWGDVLVNIDNPPNSDLTAYLLPSVKAPEELRAPTKLKEEGHLPRKKEITTQFVANYLGQQLEGLWFYRRMTDGLLRVHVYCDAYDKFLAQQTPPR
jgi:hypothetical protein